MIKTIEGNTSSTKGLVANGGCVAEKSYVNNHSKIAVIFRPKYKDTVEARKLVKTAKKYVGYCEKKSNSFLDHFTKNAGSKNWNMFAPHAKEATGSSVYANGVYWCDIFVDDMFIRAFGVARAKELLGGWSAYTPDSANKLAKVGAAKVLRDDVKCGDIIFFKNSVRICHIGIITNGYVETPASEEFDYRYEDFKEEVCGILNVRTAAQAFNKTITLSAKKNSNDILVLPVQKRLKALGFYSGVPDREFGPLTTTAVNKYQKDILKYKNCDGELTKKGKMWKTLLQV